LIINNSFYYLFNNIIAIKPNTKPINCLVDKYSRKINIPTKVTRISLVRSATKKLIFLDNKKINNY
jgi:hypothetical protein